MNTSEFKDIIYDKNEDTGLVMLTLNQPKRKNALTAYTFLEMWWAVDALQNDDTAKAMVMTGHPGPEPIDPAKEAFCSGGYFDPSSTPLTTGEKLSEDIQVQMDLTDIAQKKLTLKMWDMDKPVIAAINGFAVGAGFTMPLACADLIYASEHAWSQMPFVNLGIIPEFASTYILPRVLGFQKAKEIIYYAKKMTAQDMLDLGLVNGVVPHDELIAHAQKKALELIPPKAAWLAVRMVKQAMNKPLAEELSASLDLENEALNKAFNTADFKEAVMSRVERRAPVYHGS